MDKEKRILYIATNNPYLRTGGGLAVLAYYNALKALYPQKVDLVIPEKWKGKSSLEDTCLTIPPRSKFYSIIAALLYGYLNYFRQFVLRHIKNNPKLYSLCVINNGIYAGDMIKAVQAYGIKVAVIHHNYQKEYCMDNKTPLTLFGKSPLYVMYKERLAYKNANANLFLTKTDIKLLKEAYGECEGLVGLIGVFESDFAQLPQIKAMREESLVITGSMDSYQTENGIIDFYEKYFPYLKGEYSLLKICIAGRNPTLKIKAIANSEKENIELIANPSSMDEIIAKGSIYYCPTCIGGGLKLRVMDGLRQGLPVLVHSKSARGYEVFFDKPYFYVYDDLKTFKTSLSSILSLYKENKIDREEIQKDYCEEFGFEAGCRRIKRYFDKFIY